MRHFFSILSFLVISFSTSSQSLFLDSIITSEEARRIVYYLACDSLSGRFTGTSEMTISAHFIANEFANAGVKPIAAYGQYFSSFPFVYNGENKTGCNVLVGLTGKTKPEEVIIFSAHYDHIGTLKTNPFPNLRPKEQKNKIDTIFNGANDDASGVAAIILLARYFAALGNNERTLIFICFSGEELGLLGSKEISSRMNADQIITLINIEMIGRNPNNKIKPFITGSEFSDLRSILNDELGKTDRKLFSKSFFIDDPYPDEQLFRRSDNFTFSKAGIPAHTIMLTSPHDEFYHSIDDEPETINFDVMIAVTKAIAISCKAIINGIKTPDRITIEDTVP